MEYLVECVEYLIPDGLTQLVSKSSSPIEESVLLVSAFSSSLQQSDIGLLRHRSMASHIEWRLLVS